MAQVTKSIDELVAENSGVDRQETFEQLWAITTELFDKVKARFELSLDPSTADLGSYHGKNGAEGSLAAYSGPEIDWLIYSWTGNPKASFTNMHLTISLGPQVNVPNFGFALGTTPELFSYMDYLPRVDLWTHPEYANRYYDGGANDAYIAIERDDNFRHFISRHVYTRVAQSPCSMAHSAEVTPENIERLRELAHGHLDRWLAWVDAAEPVPAAERAALAERDLLIRRTITEGDPANIVVENLFGTELADRLVHTLWGRDRKLPRPQ